MSENPLPPPTMRASHPPPSRPWSQPPEVEEPILDAARAPLSAYFSRQGPSWSRVRKIGMYLWLQGLRPLITIAVWVAGLFYAWPYVLDAPAQPDTQRLLWLYAIVIAAIFCLMLMVAPLRRRQQAQTQAVKADDSSLMALADYIEVPPAQLSLYQKTQRLFVHHHPHGRLRTALPSHPSPQPLQMEGF